MNSSMSSPWQMVPTQAIISVLPSLGWNKEHGGSAATDLAALMIYISFLFTKKLTFIKVPPPPEKSAKDVHIGINVYCSEITYDQIENLTGLSRSLISQGITRLTNLNFVKPYGSKQSRGYYLNWNNKFWTETSHLMGGWFKIPCRSIIKMSKIHSLHQLTLRNKIELDAIKLFFYLASCRDKTLDYSVSTYETIRKFTGIQERNIRKALNVLNACELLSKISKEADSPEQGSKTWGHNHYYLSGYKDFNRNYTKNVEEGTHGFNITS